MEEKSPIELYIQLGVDTVNQYIDLNATFSQWEAQRSVVLRVCRPREDTRFYIPQWFRHYIRGQFNPEAFAEGVVVEELFSLYLDTSQPKWQLVATKIPLPQPTVTAFISEERFWEVAARSETLYSLFIKGKEIEVIGDFSLADIAHLDSLLTLMHNTLISKGIDITSLLR